MLYKIGIGSDCGATAGGNVDQSLGTRSMKLAAGFRNLSVHRIQGRVLCPGSRIRPLQHKPERRWIIKADVDPDAVIERNRAFQVSGSELLMKLLEAKDTRAMAVELAPKIGEDFFVVGSTYLDMAKKDKQLEVAARIESALKIAMEEKNKTLRPEIRLLNDLMSKTTSLQRKQTLNTKQAGDTLQLNDGYFFTLLARMTVDVETQPKGASRTSLLQQLKEIKTETTARLSGMKGFGKPRG